MVPSCAKPSSAVSWTTPAASVRRSVARRVPGDVRANRTTTSHGPACPRQPAAVTEKSAACGPASVALWIAEPPRYVTGTAVACSHVSCAGQRTIPGAIAACASGTQALMRISPQVAAISPSQCCS